MTADKKNGGNLTSLMKTFRDQGGKVAFYPHEKRAVLSGVNSRSPTNIASFTAAMGAKYPDGGWTLQTPGGSYQEVQKRELSTKSWSELCRVFSANNVKGQLYPGDRKIVIIGKPSSVSDALPYAQSYINLKKPGFALETRELQV